jgi:hypothetical protein
MHLHDTTPRLGTRRVDVPAALDILVAQLLAKDASDRPADLDIARGELRRIRQRLS